MNPTTNTIQPSNQQQQQPINPPSNQQQQQPINPSQPIPVTTTSSHNNEKHETKSHHTIYYDPIYVQQPHPYQQPVMMVPVEIDQDAAEASSAFSMAICFSIFMTCFGCICMSSIPFLFVWVMYRKSSSEKAKRLASLSLVTFIIFLVMNLCFIVMTILVVTIVPPVVVYT